MQLSIKKIKRLSDEEKPQAIARYLKNFIPPEKRNILEVRIDEYAHALVKNVGNLNRSDIEKKLEELINQKVSNICNGQMKKVKSIGINMQ
jgi:hypothetical protein